MKGRVGERMRCRIVRKIVALLFLCMFVSARETAQTYVHVSAAATSSSLSEGTRDRPFATLEEAKRYLIQHRARTERTTSLPNVVVRVHPGEYGPLSLDHPSLSFVAWEGATSSTEDGSETNLPIISGGIEVPKERFRFDNTTQAFVASLEGLGVEDLGSMIHGDCVDDCQHDKVGVTFGGESLVLARWPNAPADVKSPETWTNADSCFESGFAMNVTDHPEAARLLRWQNEKEPFVHGYWSWDWADCYGQVLDVFRDDDLVRIRYADTLPNCKSGARWMGVNLLCELDAPGADLNDTTKKVKLKYQYGGVVNVTRNVRFARLANLDVRDGRHAGILAPDTVSLEIDRVFVHGHGTHGIVAVNATNCTIRRSQVFDVGCSGIRATAGEAKSLTAGNMLVVDNTVRSFATWKRSYQPGIFWGGVANVFRGNDVSLGPHNGFLGGGDFADGVNNLFEGNVVSDVTFDTIDSGGFYTCGQRGAAFTNRGNVLRSNTFRRVRNTAGLGVQVASNQAVYLDDQMSAWLVENNTFEDCQIALFVGGGRRNLFRNNHMTRCGTAFYLNNQGMYGEFDNPTVNCTDCEPPFSTVCSTGAAYWMATRSPAAKIWRETWPEMLSIRSDYLGYPAYTELVNSTYCCASDAEICELLSSNTNVSQAESWKVSLRNNTRLGSC